MFRPSLVPNVLLVISIGLFVQGIETPTAHSTFLFINILITAIWVYSHRNFNDIILTYSFITLLYALIKITLIMGGNISIYSTIIIVISYILDNRRDEIIIPL